MTIQVPDLNATSRLPIARRRDRRQALGDLLGAVTRTLASDGDTSDMRAAFEQQLRHAVPVRGLQLRTSAGRRNARDIDVGANAEAIALEVPGANGAATG